MSNSEFTTKFLIRRHIAKGVRVLPWILCPTYGKGKKYSWHLREPTANPILNPVLDLKEGFYFVEFVH